MNDFYHKTLTELEQSGTSRDYMLGWASGYLGNPVIEEQRLTDPWQAGYDDGKGKTVDQAEQWRDGAADDV